MAAARGARTVAKVSSGSARTALATFFIALLAIARPLAAQPGPEPPAQPAPVPSPAPPPTPPPPAPAPPAATGYPQPPAAQPPPPGGYRPPAYAPPPGGWPVQPPPAPPPKAAPAPAHPPAREGFQMSMKLGADVPFGDATGESGDTQKSRYAPQFAFELALGAKLSAPVYVGGYAGAAVGNEGDDEYARQSCEGGLHDVSCSSASERLGVEIQYHFVPDGLVNPWVGYGLAYEWASQTLTDRIAGRTERSEVRGLQYGRLQTGIDFRLGKAIGLGPYFYVELGRYTQASTTIYGRETYSGAIDQTATHGWFGSGFRLVIFP